MGGGISLQDHKKSILVIIVLTLAILTIHIGGYISYEAFADKLAQPAQVQPIVDLALNRDGDDKRETKYGYIQPLVIDGFTDEAIEGAQVVIPELDLTLITGKDGLTAPIKIPLRPDNSFDKIMEKDWGELCLIIYKENYIEYVLLYTQIYEDEIRKGPCIMLFPKDPDRENQPFAVIESPLDDWVNRLVEKYRPSGQ